MMTDKQWGALNEALDRAYAETILLGQQCVELEERRIRLLNRAVAKKDREAGQQYDELGIELQTLNAQYDAAMGRRRRLDKAVTNEATRRYEALVYKTKAA